ncbi:limbin [Tiliqua scincoides]|uniref:limbin n=1 Tax=Tiliqua scincoides TaxID=71010 RepID=UPI0034619B76
MHGITFQKCAVVITEHTPQSAYVKLLINNTNMALEFNVTELVLLDNITGLHIQKTTGEKTADGFQKYRRQFLQGGEYYSVDYIAAIKTEEMGISQALTLPAKLTFQSPSLNNSELSSLTASFIIRGDKKTMILFSHGIHALGFFIAFMISFALSILAWWVAYKARRVLQKCHNEQEMGHNPDPECNLERSRFNPGCANLEDIFLNDQIIDILSLEESEKMLQSLEDFEIANLTCADRDLEGCRTQICKDVIVLLLKNTSATQRLSPRLEKRMTSTFKKLFLTMEMEIQEEYKRKMVALTAECSLENRKEAESQQRRERAANEEAEELIKQSNEKSAAKCRTLLETLHQLEHHHIKRFLMVKQEEYFAKAYRELAISERNEIHNIFFTQTRNAVFKGELKLEAAKALVEDYSKIQGDIEELMDFLQAHKKYHLSKIFVHREYLIQIVQLLDAQMSSLWHSAGNQIAAFISKVERSCHIAENHLGGVLNVAQVELHSAKQKLEHVLKQEKHKLHQKLRAARQRELLHQKEKQKEQKCFGDAFRTCDDICHYLAQWQKILADHMAEFEELTEKLDSEAKEELVALRHNLTEKATEEIKRVQYGSVLQELHKLSVPKPSLQHVVEEQKRETAQNLKWLEKDKQDKTMAAERLLQSKREKLDQELQSRIAEQRQLRDWEQLVFLKLLGLSLSLSEEELLKIRQEFHGYFSQMDLSLALPKIRERVLLQTYQSECREIALQKVDQSRPAPSKQQGSEVQTKSKNKSKMDVMKKSLEKKIDIYKRHSVDEHVNKIFRELRLEREHQLQALGNKLGEYITSLQFQRTAKIPQTLEFCMALLQLQALLLEELNTSKTMTKSDCAEILEQGSREIEELERKMEDEMAQQELTQRQQNVISRRRQNAERTRVEDDTEESNSDGQMSARLWEALNKCKQLVCLHRQNSREVQNNIVVLENILEMIETDKLLTLYAKELRLTAYLAKKTMIPAGTLHRILNLLLPASSQNELLSILSLINTKYSEAVAENDSGGEETGNFKKRKPQRSWQLLETKMRHKMINTHLGASADCSERFSVLRQKQLALLEKIRLLHPEYLPEHLQPDEVDPVGTAEVIELTDTKEKVFVFRDPTFSSAAPSKKNKKTSFLNSKKSTHIRMGV